MTYVLVAWAVFVGLVYMLMWVDYITHKRSIKEAFRSFKEEFQNFKKSFDEE